MVTIRPLARVEVAVAVVLGMILLLGCTEAGDPELPDVMEQVEVGGEVGVRPQVRFDAPLDIAETVTGTIVTGDGDVLAEGDAVMLSYLWLDAATGEVVESSYGDQPRILQLTPDEAGPLYEDLLGQTEGSRLLRFDVGSVNRPEPVVIVYDILPTRATGTELTTPEGAPAVTRDEDGVPTVTLPETDPPSSLTSIPLIRGSGTQVRAGEFVTLQMVRMEWGEGEILESTWEEGELPITVSLGDRWPGLQEGLLDTTVGSQILLVIPPELADGTSTMVFVIDVLGVTTTADAQEGSGS